MNGQGRMELGQMCWVGQIGVGECTHACMLRGVATGQAMLHAVGRNEVRRARWGAYISSSGWRG